MWLWGETASLTPPALFPDASQTFAFFSDRAGLQGVLLYDWAQK